MSGQNQFLIAVGVSTIMDDSGITHINGVELTSDQREIMRGLTETLPGWSDSNTQEGAVFLENIHDDIHRDKSDDVGRAIQALKVYALQSSSSLRGPK